MLSVVAKAVKSVIGGLQSMKICQEANVRRKRM
jgi:hypothetical protein